ncbi:hypothetical protein F5B20DRAFT_596272 [Whalleya microplaca]|nr:hypothetical protein F5B20DRAFT_596272 [Whalleya microplaca]
MDAIEKFFSDFPPPKSDRDRPFGGESDAYIDAIKSFCDSYRASGQYISTDSDLQTIATIALRALQTTRPVLAFKNHIAQFAIENVHYKNEYSAKAKQLRYFRWVAQAVCKSYDQVYFHTKNAFRPTCKIEQGRYMNNMFGKHSVIRATVTSDEQFAVDLTGAQFGWAETLVPWQVYMQHRQASEETRAEELTHPELEPPLSDDQKAQRSLRYLVSDIIAASIKTTLREHGHSMIGMFQLEPEKHLEMVSKIVSLAEKNVRVFLAGLSGGKKGRLYYDNNFRLRLTSTINAKILERLWLTEEEYESFRGNKESLRREWEARLGRVNKLTTA